MKDHHGKTVDVVSSGSRVAITKANAQRYIKMVTSRLISPYLEHVDLIRQGLLQLVPQKALSLCSAEVV